MYYDARLDCWVFVETDGILPNSVNGLVTVLADSFAKIKMEENIQ